MAAQLHNAVRVSLVGVVAHHGKRHHTGGAWPAPFFKSAVLMILLVVCGAGLQCCSNSTKTLAINSTASFGLSTPKGPLLVMMSVMQRSEGAPLIAGPIVVFPASQGDRVGVVWSPEEETYHLTLDKKDTMVLPKGIVVSVDADKKTVRTLALDWDVRLNNDTESLKKFIESLKP